MSIPKNIRYEYCDCMVMKLKLVYPHGMNGKISKDNMKKIVDYCTQVIIKKHPELN